MTNARKTLLFILQRAPYGDSTTRETLDAALAAAAFEQNVQLLFIGDGVWNLLLEQNADCINSKDTGKMLQALNYYDIEAVFSDNTSLQERGLSADNLAIAVKNLNDDAVKNLVRAADCVIAL